MTKKSQQFHTSLKFGPEKCPVYLHLPWLGLVSNQFEKQVTSSVKHCYLTVLYKNVVYHTLFTKPTSSFLWPIRMCCLPYKIVTSFTNFHATAIVGMLAALPKVYKTESNNMFRNLSVMALLPQNVTFQFANANIPTSQQYKFNL